MDTILIIIILAGLIGFGISMFPIPKREIVQIISGIILIASAYNLGIDQERSEWELKVAQMNEEIATLEAQSNKVTTQVVTKYVDRVKIVKENSDAIVNQVPVFIDQTADDRCIVPTGFVVLHDAAAKNEVPDSTRDSNADPSGVKLSAVASTVAGNYGNCHQNSEQLKALQDWVREQEVVFNKDQ